MCNYCNKNDRFLPKKFGRINNCITFAIAIRQGQLPEWPNGADCNSADLRLRWFESITAHRYCGSSSVDRALAFQAEGRGVEPRLPLYRRSTYINVGAFFCIFPLIAKGFLLNTVAMLIIVEIFLTYTIFQTSLKSRDTTSPSIRTKKQKNKI